MLVNHSLVHSRHVALLEILLRTLVLIDVLLSGIVESFQKLFIPCILFFEVIHVLFLIVDEFAF